MIIFMKLVTSHHELTAKYYVKGLKRSILWQTKSYLQTSP